MTDVRTTPCADWIAKYHDLGWNVIPLVGGLSRNPSVTWKNYQTERITDEQVADWAKFNPGANLAVVCGEVSGNIVVDIDSPEGQAICDERGMPHTPTVRTGSGKVHYYLKRPGWDIKNREYLPGLEIKSTGGLATLPPSIHHKTGKPFAWEVDPWDTPLADPPGWLLELIKEPPAPPPSAPYAPAPTNGQDPYKDTAMDGVLSELSTTTENRNNALNNAALRLGQFVGAGRLDRAEAEHQLCTVAQAIGLDKGEIDATIKSGLDAGMSKPEYEGLKTDPVVRKRPTPELAQGTARATPEPEPEPPPAQEPVISKAVSTPKVVSADYIAALTDLGYTFRLNDCDDSIEVNGQYLADPLRSKIRAQIRDIGFKGMDALEDAYTAAAYDHRYHPIREYLDALVWDKEPHIATLASFFTDEHNVFYRWLRSWLVGAVSKAYTGSQNPMLVLAGGQDVGKSYFATWVCPLPTYFHEGPINTDDKDTYIRLMNNWVWEVSELGSTTRKADRESLKQIITMGMVEVRKPYNRADTKKPALASFIGTINSEGGGFLSDPTGNRRFIVCNLTAIDWAYADQIDVNQVWAEAVAAYHADESPRLTPEETVQSQAINAEYEIDDPIEDLLQKYFIIDPGNADLWTATVDILDVLESNGLRGTRKSNSMALAITLTRLGCVKGVGRVENGKRARGYRGIGQPKAV